MSDVLIVARTQMGHGNVCIGGYDTGNRRNVRLLDAGGANQSGTCPYQLGQIWRMSYTPRINMVPPHTEDVLVSSSTHLQLMGQQQLAAYIMQHCVVVTGSSSKLFNGCLQFPQSGAAYISNDNVPNHSVCFWQIDNDLYYTNTYGKDRFRYFNGVNNTYLPYVGAGAQVATISAGSVVRVSLARWWSPPGQDEEHCYLQLSGWY